MISQPPTRNPRLTPRRLRGQLAALAVAIWVVAIVDAATPGWLLRSGQVKGTDFVHFYTLARLGAEGRAGSFDDLAAQRAVQVAAVPESAGDWFAPAYGPQVALVLAPLGHLPYGAALLCWLAITTALYLAAVLFLTRTSAALRRHQGLVVLAALAFPPFWELIVHGQLSIVAMTLVVLAWAALQRGRPGWAGAVLGLLAYKPSLAVPVLGVLILARAWRMVGPALATSVGQVLVAALWIGRHALASYGQLLLDSPRLAIVLASKIEQMHSWRAFWSLLVPDPRIAVGLYAATALLTVLVAAAVWRTNHDPALRMTALVLATVLASPHLYVYDLIVLTPVWVWLTEWYLARPELPPAVGRLLYAGFALPLVAAAFTKVIRVQFLTLCLASLLVFIWQSSRSARQSAGGTELALLAADANVRQGAEKYRASR